jgi:type IV pilus assembly protein PilV
MHLKVQFRQGGFSLLELSVATAIYSMGLGSVSMMLLLAVQGTATARLETAAALHAASLAEAIAMSSDAVGHYLYPVDGAACAPESVCGEDELAAWNLRDWQARVAADLPQGAGLLCRDRTPADGTGLDAACDGSGPPVIKIFWETGSGDGPSLGSHRRVSRLPVP